MTDKELNNVVAAGVITLVASFAVDTVHRIWSRHKTDKAFQKSIEVQTKRDEEMHQRFVDQANELDRQILEEDEKRNNLRYNIERMIDILKEDDEEEDD